jgi:hypothetical protein
MTPSDIQTTKATIERAWPKLRWSPDEWSIFVEGCKNIRLEAAQAVAVIREYKRTDDRYPAVARLLRALKAAITPDSRTPELTGMDEGEHRDIGMLRRQMLAQNVEGAHKADAPSVIWTYYLRAASRSVRLYGYVHDQVFEGLRVRLQTLCGYDGSTAAACEQALIDRFAEHLDPGPPTPQQELNRRWLALRRAHGNEKAFAQLAALVQEQIKIVRTTNPKARLKQIAAMAAAGDKA